ncbi:MAG: hypothetical protein LC749_06030, partial [Actinobacteria bacterium]|nr:hypothetical protein [Actinomycetota bacterium]
MGMRERNGCDEFGVFAAEFGDICFFASAQFRKRERHAGSLPRQCGTTPVSACDVCRDAHSVHLVRVWSKWRAAGPPDHGPGYLFRIAQNETLEMGRVERGERGGLTRPERIRVDIAALLTDVERAVLTCMLFHAGDAGPTAAGWPVEKWLAEPWAIAVDADAAAVRVA